MPVVSPPIRFGLDRSRLEQAGATPELEPTASEAPSQLTMAQRIVRIAGALLFSWFYASIPWHSWRPRSFKDVAAYVAQIEALRANAEELDFENLTSAEYIFSEPLWRQLLAALDFTNNPMDALILITFGVVAVFTTHLFVRASPWLVMFLMFNPVMIDLVVSQTRSALAAALLLIAANSKRPWLSLFIVATASLIHSITFLLVTIYILARVIERFGNRYDYVTLGWATLAIGVLFAIAVALGRTDALQAVGDRRGYIENTGGSTVTYTLYWFLLACAIALTYRIQSKIEWVDLYVILVLVIPLVTTIFSVATTRLVALCLPLTVDSMFARPRGTRIYLALSLVAYQILHYQYWLT